MNRADVLVTVCFATIFAIGLGLSLSLSVGSPYAIAGLPDFSSSGNEAQDNNSVSPSTSQTQQQEQTPIKPWYSTRWICRSYNCYS